jgi:hypothetical protein
MKTNEDLAAVAADVVEMLQASADDPSRHVTEREQARGLITRLLSAGPDEGGLTYTTLPTTALPTKKG